MLSDSQQQILASYGERIVNQLRNAFAERTASGALVNSIRYEVNDQGLRILADDYIVQASEGRGPGKPPPREAIKEWIENKGISYNIPIDSLAFLIQRKIATKGTNAWQQHDNILNDVFTPELQQEIAAAMTESISQSLISEIKNALKT